MLRAGCEVKSHFLVGIESATMILTSDGGLDAEDEPSLEGSGHPHRSDYGAYDAPHGGHRSRREKPPRARRRRLRGALRLDSRARRAAAAPGVAHAGRNAPARGRRAAVAGSAEGRTGGGSLRRLAV